MCSPEIHWLYYVFFWSLSKAYSKWYMIWLSIILSLSKTAGHVSQKFQVPAHVGALQRPRLRGDLPGADWKSRGKQRRPERCRGDREVLKKGRLRWENVMTLVNHIILYIYMLYIIIYIYMCMLWCIHMIIIYVIIWFNLMIIDFWWLYPMVINLW